MDNMRLGDNIAKNAALRENVFMMAICIELRIPLFIVGKPGSSKSLAKSVIHASMRGKSSQNELLRDFKEVDMFSYQCSQLSTPESVIEVFNTAKRFQSKQDTKSYVAVVVLDEVGLAEDSPNLPLKALHPLLEDGTEGAGAEGKNDVVKYLSVIVSYNQLYICTNNFVRVANYPFPDSKTKVEDKYLIPKPLPIFLLENFIKLMEMRLNPHSFFWNRSLPERKE